MALNIDVEEVATDPKENKLRRALWNLTNKVVLSRIDSLPLSPGDDDIYIMTVSAASHDNEIAFYYDGDWIYLVPDEGWLVYIVDENIYVYFNGTIWVELIEAGAVPKPYEFLTIAVSDETTDITTGTAKVTFRLPYAFNLEHPDGDLPVSASLSTASSSGNPTFDINEGGVSILSTKLSIDSGEKTSTTAATPAVLSDTALAKDAELTIDIDTAGTGAKGAKITLVGRRT